MHDTGVRFLRSLAGPAAIAALVACAEGQSLSDEAGGAGAGGSTATGGGGGSVATGGVGTGATGVGAGAATPGGGTGGAVGTGGASGAPPLGGTAGMAGTSGAPDSGAGASGGPGGSGGNAGTGTGMDASTPEGGAPTGADGDPCTSSADCLSNVCAGDICCTNAGCADDGDPCTDEICESGSGLCQHVASGNQDGDRLDDCDEDADPLVSRNKYVFNGMTASLINGGGGGNCTEMAYGSQIADLFSTPVETRDIYAGWEFDTDQPESQAPNSATFGFMPPFTSTFIGWRMLYRGLFWVPANATGQYCFNVDIGSDGGSDTDDNSPDACGAIYLPDVQTNAWVMNGRHQSSTSDSPPMPSESDQRTKCTTFDTAGPQRIDFVYQYSENNPDNRHQLHVRYCFGGASSCTPDSLIDDDVLTPVGATIPTCADGAHNGGETGVDCGGPDCSPC